MFSYYLGIALRSLRRTRALSTLIVVAVGVGIGSAMTVYSLLRGMSTDPIPDKSSQLFAVQIDNFGPERRDEGEPPVQLSWRDASALLEARAAKRQAAMFPIDVRVALPDGAIDPFLTPGRAASADFFPMFDVPLRAGRFWTAEEDRARANVVVLSDEVAGRLFPSGGAVGRSVQVDGRDYRVIGVTAHWNPLPRFFDLGGGRNAGGFDAQSGVYLPVQTAVERELGSSGSYTCWRSPAPGYHNLLASECVWLQFWVELATAADVGRYRRHLENYAAEQQRAGRFQWDPLVKLHDVRDWLTYRRVVPNELRAANTTAFGFLFVCLLNAVGLMLARGARAQRDLELRRALGASRSMLLTQGLIEAGILGLSGGILGFALALLGLGAERALLPEELKTLTEVDGGMLMLTLALGVGAALVAGLYPAWRASRRTGTVRDATRVGYRAGTLLIGLQIALTLAIVSNAALLAREHVRRTHRPSGLVEQGLFVVGSRTSVPPDEQRARVGEDLAAIRALPGVVDAYATWTFPLAGGGAQIFADRKPLEDATMNSSPRAAEYVVDDHAARTLGLEIVAGRWFDADDVRDGGPPAEAPVIIITQALAMRLFPQGGAVGGVVYKHADYPSTVVGVVKRMQTPWPQPGWASSFIEQSILVPRRYAGPRTVFMVRAREGEATASMDAVQKRLRELDPGRVIEQARAFAEVRERIYRVSRALSSTLATVSVLLLIVTGLGIVGLTAYWSAQRRHQIGVRRALGARRADILRRFQAENLLIAGGGLLAGSALALAINLAMVKAVEMSRMSFGELLVMVTFLLVLAQSAALWPAVRAASVPPALATRSG